MRKFAFIFLVLTSSILNGQITINNSHMPNNGDSLRFSLSILDTALVSNYQNAGSNLTWNYDSLIPVRQGISEYIASSQSPYNVSNRIAEKLADTIDLAGTEVYDLYNFYSSDTSSFSITHRGATVPTGLGFPFPSTLKVVQSSIDKDEVYQFPLDYLDRDSSNYDLEYTNTFPSAFVGSSGYRINDVDAWGSLTTPFGTFNCIRVVTDIVGYDTVDAGSNTTGINSHQREYKWLTTQFEIAALTIRGTVDSGVFVPSAIQYRDSVRNVPSLFVPFPLFTTNDTLVGIGDTVNFSNSSISFLSTSYQWDIQPTNFQYINGTSAITDSITVIFNDTGYYDVKLIATSSGGSDSLLKEDYIRVDIITSIKEVFRKDERLLVYPNPVASGSQISIQLKDSEEIKSIQVYDINGRSVFAKSGLINVKSIQFSISEPPGNYIIQVQTKCNELRTKRLMIK